MRTDWLERKEREEEKWPENQEKLYKEHTPDSARTSGISKPTYAETTFRDDIERKPASAKTEAPQKEIPAEDKGKSVIMGADNQAETR
jgi:hypothetical protein